MNEWVWLKSREDDGRCCQESVPFLLRVGDRLGEESSVLSLDFNSPCPLSVVVDLSSPISSAVQFESKSDAGTVGSRFSGGSITR